MSASNITIEGGEGLGQKRVCQFTDQEIENIRKKDPDARIMKVVYDDVERVLTMEEVKNTLTTIRGLFEGYRKETPEATDDAIRDLICEKSAAAKSMREKTHPKLFLAVTSRETSEDQFSMISFNIHLREQVEKGVMTEEDSVAALYAEMIRRNHGK